MNKAITLMLLFMLGTARVVLAQPASESGSIGVQGTVTAPPPGVAPTISTPGSGTTFNKIPVSVGGICQSELLVKVFKNGVFAGSTQCTNGSYALQIDLFSGRNDLTAKQYDLLDQESPSSAVTEVNYAESVPDKSVTERVVLTSNYAKRGANPREKLLWPIIISGGTAPYAVTIEWGDGETSLLSVATPGEFVIEHTYTNPGVYNLIVKAADASGKQSFLQLVAIGNGDLAETAGGATAGTTGSSGGNVPGSFVVTDDAGVRTRIVWQPAAIMIPFIVSTFWLGRRYAIYRIRKKIESGERPFSY